MSTSAKPRIGRWVWVAIGVTGATLIALRDQLPKLHAANVDPDAIRAVAALKALRPLLREPGSFELVEARSVPPGVLCFEYRARNGFGGVNIERAFERLQTLHMQTTPTFAADWNVTCGSHSVGVDLTLQVQALL